MNFSIFSEDKTWPILLKNYSSLVTLPEYFGNISLRSNHIHQSFKNFLEKGFINLDKPVGWNSFEIIFWLKNFLEIRKIGMMDSLSLNISGCLIICFNKALTLKKIKFEPQKNYICVLKFENLKNKDFFYFQKKIDALRGILFQRPLFFLQ
jgi:H/ACA ribonucleoprotein complex subunit 4